MVLFGKIYIQSLLDLPITFDIVLLSNCICFDSRRIKSKGFMANVPNLIEQEKFKAFVHFLWCIFLYLTFLGISILQI